MIKSKTDNLIELIEGAGDILCYSIRNNHNDITDDLASRFKAITVKLISIEHDDHIRYRKLFINTNDFTKALDITIKQLFKIYEASIYSTNKNISHVAISSLNIILSRLSFLPDQELYISTILKKNILFLHKSIETNSPSVNSSLNWYYDILFPLSVNNKFNFDYKYTSLFSRNFCTSIQIIIDYGTFNNYLAFLDSIHHRIHIPDYDKGKIYNIRHFSKNAFGDNVFKKTIFLAKKQEQIRNEDDLTTWLSDFSELVTHISVDISGDDSIKFNELCSKIEKYTKRKYYYMIFLDIIYALCSYCIYKNKYDYINELWTYKQPPESEAIWVGHDIVPKTLHEAINLFFLKDFSSKFHFEYKGHISHEHYHLKYFIYLISRLIPSNIDDAIGIIFSYKVPTYLSIYEISSLQHRAEHIIPKIKLFATDSNIINNKASISDQNYTLSEIPDLPELLKMLFTHIADSCKSILYSVEIDKEPQTELVINFKNQIGEGYIDNCLTFSLFKATENIIYSDHSSDSTSGFQSCTLLDKAQFFEEWYISYINDGTEFGESIARKEDSEILNSISQEAIEVNISELNTAIESIGCNNCIIIAINNGSEYFEIDNNNFIWDSNSTHPNCIGYYRINSFDIPVYGIYDGNINKGQILILNKHHIGVVEYFIPNNACADIFYNHILIEIEFFKNNSGLLTTLLNKNLPFILEKGNKEEQINYLYTQAQLYIETKFIWRKTDNFIAYKILFS
jgi:hypothetical protein